MFCALTNNGDTVWATFLAKPIGPTMYLHTAPALGHDYFNLTLDDIDYSTVTEDFGILVTKANFKERALGVWSFRGPMELKTLATLEGRASGLWNNPIDLTGDDGSDDDFSNIPVKLENTVEADSSVDGTDEDVAEKEVTDEDAIDEDVVDEDVVDEDVGDEDVGDEDVGDEDVGDEDVGDEDVGDEDAESSGGDSSDNPDAESLCGDIDNDDMAVEDMEVSDDESSSVEHTMTRDETIESQKHLVYDEPYDLKAYMN
jgi:hypothetical protein